MIYSIVQLDNMLSNLFRFCGLSEFPDLRIVTQQASLELWTDLLAWPLWHIDFPSLLADDTKYYRLRMSDMAHDTTQMKWGWYQVG